MSEHQDQTPDAGHVPTGTDYVSHRDFVDFPLSPEILKGIHELGYKTATAVQAAAIEPALAGKDLVVRAKTGTGKTAAFAIPTIERIEDGARKARALVLAPTRELAQQIAEEMEALAAYRDVSVAIVVGGMPIGAQTKAIERGAEIIVGTPGRVLDLIRRKVLDCSAISTAILDEADEMLSMGFFEDVTAILDQMPTDRQVLLFSATISPDTQRIVQRYTKDVEDLILSTDTDNVEHIEHVLYETVPGFHKVRALLYLLDLEDPTSAIIFCNTREDTSMVASYLDRQGLDAIMLSGELPQVQRNHVMAKVKRGEVRFLVSTDVASRGIDISDLSHVINYSLPKDAPIYLHRVGRTGRIGKKGTAISLVGATDLNARKTLENQHGIKFDVKMLPDAETSVRMRVDRQAAQIRNAMGTMAFEAYLPTVRALKDREDGDVLLAAALRAFFTWDRMRHADVIDLGSQAEQLHTEKREREREEGRDRKGGKGKGRDRDRDRGDRGDRGERREERREERPRKADKPSNTDFDALLDVGAVGGETEDAKPKRKRNRKRKRKTDGDAASPAPAATAGHDDLDALLEVD